MVSNVSAVPCVRALDKGLQEIVLLDGSGNRLWGSNDCFPEASSDVRTLAPGEVVAFPLVWGGLTSEPTCTAPARHARRRATTCCAAGWTPRSRRTRRSPSA